MNHKFSIEIDGDIRAGMESECWVWRGDEYALGYGRYYDPRTKRQRNAHGMSWEETYGPRPAGMGICHRCDNRLCVRPDHLFSGTQKDNMSDCAKKGRKESTLTVAHVRQIRRDALCGRHGAISRLSEQYGVSVSTIVRAIRGATSWEHVTDPPGSPGFSAKHPTHCRRGHVLSSANLGMHHTGRRFCRTCRSARSKLLRAAKAGRVEVKA